MEDLEKRKTNRWQVWTIWRRENEQVAGLEGLEKRKLNNMFRARLDKNKIHFGRNNYVNFQVRHHRCVAK